MLVIPTEVVNPWTGPAIFAAIVGSVGVLLGLVNLARDVWRNRITIRVLQRRIFNGPGFAGFEVEVTNAGLRPFTLRGIELLSVGAETTSIDLPTPTLIAPGASHPITIDDWHRWL